MSAKRKGNYKLLYYVSYYNYCLKLWKIKPNVAKNRKLTCNFFINNCTET